jgi:hypothetical protein
MAETAVLDAVLSVERLRRIEDGEEDPSTRD